MQTRSLSLSACLLALAACKEPVVVAPPPPPPVAPPALPQVLDAFSAADRAWVHADGRLLRQAVLPDLLQAASALRADVQVELATAASQCGFQPLLAVDELLLRMRWAGERTEAWAAVFRMQVSPDQSVACLSRIAPDTREVSLDGRRAWQLPGGVVTLNQDVFVAASSPVEAQATLARMARPEPAAIQARSAFAGAMLSASALSPNPFGVDSLGARWTPVAAGSRLEVHARFPGDTSSKQVEAIVRDGLLQVLGSNASFDPGGQAVAERFVQGAKVTREGPALDVVFDMPPLAGKTALVSRLTALAVRGARLQTAWDLTGEARDAVFAIAKALVDYATRSRAPGHAAHFPPSAPLVPDEIPYGKRVVPNPHAFLHPSWQDIHYSSDRPTYYAFDFVTAKDGRSTVVRARGDIDGDGTTSLFELDVRLGPHDAPTIAPVIRERDPEE